MTRRVFGIVLSALVIGGVSAMSCQTNKTSTVSAKSEESASDESDPSTTKPAEKAGEHQYIVSKSQDHPMEGQTYVVAHGSRTSSEPGDQMTTVDIEMIVEGQMSDDRNGGNSASHTVMINGEVVDSSQLDEQLPPQVREMLKQEGLDTYRALVDRAMASSGDGDKHVEMIIEMHSDEDWGEGDTHEESHEHRHPMWQRIDQGEIAMEFLQNEALVTLWALNLMKTHVEPATRADMVGKLLDTTNDQNLMQWQRACRNAMLITLMETQVEMGDTPKANATLMSIVEENMNGTRPKNTSE